MPFKRSRPISLLLGVIVFGQVSALATNSIARANTRSRKKQRKACD